MIGHTNLPTVTHCYAQLLDIIQSRNLQTVTLNDVFTWHANQVQPLDMPGCFAEIAMSIWTTCAGIVQT